MSNVKKLVLGTAQFGLDYGVTNATGEVSMSEVESILRTAMDAGVTTLDTAIDYGASETKLGQVGVSNWRVVSKLPEIHGQGSIESIVFSQVEQSLQRLGIDQLYGLLLHRPAQLFELGGSLIEVLNQLKQAGLVQRTGVSVYTPEELTELLNLFDFDIVQIPRNVFDLRFERSGLLNRLSDSGTEVHSRSTFLQGLLLTEPSRLPVKFKRWHSLWLEWQEYLNKHSASALSVCLHHCLAAPELSGALVGVESRTQLNEILESSNALVELRESFVAPQDENLLNPVKWGTL